MKKLLTLCISFILILQTVVIPVAAQDIPELNGLTDAAKGCAAFASTWKPGFGAESAVDGDPDTVWKSGDSMNEHRFVLDLGSEYSIDTIGYLPQADDEAAAGFEVYLSNDNEFLDKTLVYSQGDSAAPLTEKTYLTVEEAEAFRYVVVEKSVSAGRLGIAEINVYVQNDGEAIEHEATYHHVNNNMKGNRYGGAPSGLSAKAFSCESDVGQKAFHTSNGNPIYFMFDLGSSQNIGYVTYSASTAAEIPSENDLGHRTDFKVIGSNSANYSDYDVLATQEGLAGNPDSNYSGMVLYETDEQYKGNKYRYVGIMAEKMVGGKVSFAVNSLNIFSAKTVVSLKDKVDVAVDCAAFASTYKTLHAPQNAVDGNPNTYWMSGNSSAEHGFVVDLGMEYPISIIGYLPANDFEAAGEFTIYGSNDNELVEKEVLATQGGPASSDETSYYEVSDGASYRYISVEKSSSDGALGIAELNVYVHQDYISDTFGENNRVIHITNNLKAMRAGGSPSGLTASAFSSENNTSLVTHSSDGSPLYMMFDLGTPQTISHVLYSLNSVGTDDTQMDNRSNFMFIGTNDPSYQNYDVLVYQEGLAGRPSVKYSGLVVYETDEAYRDTAYRYVGALAEEVYAGKVRFSANTMNFYTRAANVAPVAFGNLVAVMEDGELNVRGSVLSGSEGSFIFSAFDKNNQYLGCCGAENVLENGGTGNLDITVDFKAEDIAAEYIDHIQMLVIDNLSDMNLLGVVNDLTGVKEIITFENRDASEYEEEVTRNTQTYTFNGSTDAESVFALVMDQGVGFDAGNINEIRYAEAKKPGDEGEFSFKFTFSDADALGEYEMKIGSENSMLCGSSQVNILENIDTTELVQEFKTVSATDFSALFDKYKDYFSQAAADIQLIGDEFGNMFVMMRDHAELFDSELTEIDSVQDVEAILGMAVVAGCVKSEKDYDSVISPYTKFMPDVFSEYYDGDEFEELMTEVKKHIDLDSAEDFAEAMKRAVALSLIQEGNSKEIITALEKYADALGISEKTLNTDVTYLQIAKNLKNSATAVKGYASGMNKEVADIISDIENTKKDNSPSGGGSGGGGGGYKGYPAKPVEVAPVVPTVPEVSEETVRFDDLEGYAWAKDSVYRLAEQEILNGKGEGIFDPGATLTREEAVKLIVLTFGFDISDEKNTFEDCEKDAWYYPYVSSAVRHNIVKGISAKEFGVGTKVTRQDLITMIYRALDNRGFNSERVTLFEDYDHIDVYAQYAVSVLASAGIINGYEDGCFMPKNNTTRAEAAVIFDRALNLYEQMNAD